MNKETKQETLDICVTAKFRDKEIAVVDLLKALLDENEKLKEENQHIFANVNDDELLRSNAMNWAEANKLQQRINKAIEYIEKHKQIAMFADLRKEGTHQYTIECDADELLKILKGEE